MFNEQNLNEKQSMGFRLSQVTQSLQGLGDQIVTIFQVIFLFTVIYYVIVYFRYNFEHGFKPVYQAETCFRVLKVSPGPGMLRLLAH